MSPRLGKRYENGLTPPTELQIKLSKVAMTETVNIKDGILIIKEGDGYYDTRASFEVDKLIRLVEFVGVKGGHVGWELRYMDLDRNGEWFENGWDFGRKVRGIMEEVKKLINSGELKIEYEMRLDEPTRCY